MAEREQLELAAKAMGWASWDFLPGGGRLNVYDSEGRCDLFAPHLDQAESDRMACKLRMSTRISYDHAFAVVTFPKLVDATVIHNNTDEDVCRAVREARLAVAVEIGRGK